MPTQNNNDIQPMTAFQFDHGMDMDIDVGAHSSSERSFNETCAGEYAKVSEPDDNEMNNEEDSLQIVPNHENDNVPCGKHV